MTTSDIVKLAKKSSLSFKQSGRDRVQVSARFAYKSATYTVAGAIDRERGRAEPFIHKLALGGNRVYDMSVAIAATTVRTELDFGSATSGVRRAVFTNEQLSTGSTLTTGFADGKELVPTLAGSCSCKRSERVRPVLSWSEDDDSVQPVTLAFKSAKNAGDLVGLGQVMTTVIARENDGGFGDIADCIHYGLCLLGCAVDTLGCLIDSLTHPRPDIFAGLCLATSGSCPGICNFNRTFPS